MSGQESDCDQTSDQEERTVIEGHTLSQFSETLEIIGEFLRNESCYN